MATKETIALVFDADEICAELIDRFAAAQYRLLLVTEHVHQLRSVVDQSQGRHPDAEIEIIQCVKEGCWEADIIVLLLKAEYSSSFLEKIKEVSTQKIVIGMTVQNLKKHDQLTTGALKLQLPYSKIVQLVSQCKGNKAFVGGEDKEASDQIAVLAEKLGYKTERIFTI